MLWALGCIRSCFASLESGLAIVPPPNYLGAAPIGGPELVPPQYKWLEKVTPIPDLPCTTKGLMCKWDEQCNKANNIGVRPVLITAVGASGTMALRKQLEGGGIKLGVEKIDVMGMAGWPGRCVNGDADMLQYMTNNKKKFTFGLVRMHFTSILHQLRHPLKTIASYLTFSVNMASPSNVQAWEYIDYFTWPYDPLRFKDEQGNWRNPIERSAIHWLTWNELIEQVADYRFRVEDEGAPEEVCRFMSLQFPNLRTRLRCNDIKAVEKTFNAHNRANYKLTWGDLAHISPILANRVWEKARQYGYERTPPIRVITMADIAHSQQQAARSAHMISLRSDIKIRYPGARVLTIPQDTYFALFFPEYVIDGDSETGFWFAGYPHINDGVVIDLTEAALSVQKANTIRVWMGDPLRPRKRPLTNSMTRAQAPERGLVSNGVVEVLVGHRSSVPPIIPARNSSSFYPQTKNEYCLSKKHTYTPVVSISGLQHAEASIQHLFTSPSDASASVVDANDPPVILCVRIRVTETQPTWFGVREIEISSKE